MPSMAWILIVGFVMVFIELGMGMQSVGVYLDKIGKDLGRISEQLEGIEKIKNTLEWTNSGSFAEDLQGWLEEVGRAVGRVEDEVGRVGKAIGR
jgi:uncharacterized protein YoxC